MAKQRDKPVRDATRDDVARLAAVSSAVVSYVVNDGPRPVAPATRARVLDAIAKLDYRPNKAARSLITGRSHLLGLIVPDLENQYFAGLAKAVEKEAGERGLRLVLAQSASEGIFRHGGLLGGAPSGRDHHRHATAAEPVRGRCLDAGADWSSSASPCRTTCSQRCGRTSMAVPRVRSDTSLGRTTTSGSRWSPAPS